MLCPECVFGELVYSRNNQPVGGDTPKGDVHCPQCETRFIASLDQGLKVKSNKTAFVPLPDTIGEGIIIEKGVIHRMCEECGRIKPESDMRFGIYTSPHKVYSERIQRDSGWDRTLKQVIEFDRVVRTAYFPTRRGWFCPCAHMDRSVISYTRKNGVVDKHPRWREGDRAGIRPEVRAERQGYRSNKGFDRKIHFKPTLVRRSKG